MKLFIFLSTFLFSSIALASGTCKVEGEAVIGILEFEISNCKIDGELKRQNGKLGGTFTVDLTSLDTGIKLRNQHMRDKYLETSKYPKAKLVLKPVKYGAKKFVGSFTLHGKTKLVEGEVIHASGDKLEAKFPIDIMEYGINEPGYKGIVIGRHLTVFATVK